MAIIEKIKVVLELLTDKFTGQMRQAEKVMKKVNQQTLDAAEATQKMSSSQKISEARMKDFNNQNMKGRQVMNMSLESLKSFNEQGFKFNRVTARAANGIRNLTHGMRGFRMEALGVMFFGMSMQKMFLGLLQPVMQAFGVFDLFRLMLTVLFLPIMESIFPSLLAMMELFMNLSGPVKKAIGIFVLVGVILGTIIMIVGMLTLGFGSLILFGPILGAALSAAFLPVLAIIAVVVAVIFVLRTAWKENFLGMRTIVETFISGIKDFFSGLVMFFQGVFMIIKGIFLGDWGIILDGMKLLVVGFLKTVWGLFKLLVSTIGVILVGIVRIFWGIVKLIIAPFKWLWNKLVGEDSIMQNIVDGIVDWFKGLGDRIVPWIKDMARKIKDHMMKIIPDWMIDLFTGNFSIGGGGGRSDGDGKPSQSEDDFIWRPGQGAVGINPNDTLVGFKGAPPTLGSGEGINVTNNFYGFTMSELERELDSRDRDMVAKMERNR